MLNASLVKQIFHQALDAAPHDRSAVLRNLCNGDEHLRAVVKSMLRFDEGPECFLDSKIIQARIMDLDGNVGLRIDDDVAADLAGSTVGRYTILNQIGEGGMGTVYLAQQEAPSRKVALKVLRAFMTPNLRRRFTLEAEVLGHLQHPNIAQVYEAGTHAGPLGEVPYFAMELIPDACTITEYCQRANLSPQHVLELFIKVCDAVHHAHQRGVIHRDLKPSNILMGEVAEPKVIDFGVARIDDAAFTAAATLHTTVGQIIGTLRYMSPEQCSGDPQQVDTRSDVYALGIVLYELLTGQMPYDLTTTASVWQLPRIICDTPPKLPSTITRSVRGDLETIVLKALAKEPQRRYASAEALAADIRRYLAGEPIEAKRDHALYVLRKSIGRYRRAIAVVSGFLVLSSLSAIVFAALYTQAELARSETAAKNLELRHENYFALIALADDAIQRNAITEARQLIQRCPEDLRHWEWRFLFDSLDDASFKHELRNNLIPQALTPDRSAVLAISPFTMEPKLALIDLDRNEPLWVMSKDELQDFKPHSARMSPDGKYIAVHLIPTADAKPVVQVHEIRSRSHLFTIESAQSMQFTHDSRQIVVSEFGGRIQVWDLETREQVLNMQGPGSVHSQSLSSDNRLWAVGTNGGPAGGTVAVVDLESSRVLWQHTGAHQDHVRSVAFSRDNQTLYTASAGRVCVWNIVRGEVISIIMISDYQFGHMDVSLDDRTIAIPMTTGLGLYDLQTGYRFRTLRGQEGAQRVRFLDSNSLVSFGWGNSHLRLWDLNRATATSVVAGHAQWAIHNAYSHDGQWMSSVGEEGTLHLRDGSTAGVIGSASVLARGRGCVQFSPDDARLAHGRVAGPISIFEVPSMQLMREIPIRDVPVYSDSSLVVRWDPTGRYVFAGSGDQILVFDAESGEEVDRRRTPHQGPYSTICTIALHPEGTMLASMDNAGQIALWNIESGGMGSAIIPRISEQPLRFWQAHDRVEGAWGHIMALEFSPDGTLLASGNHDQTMRVWDVQTGVSVHVLRGNSSAIHDVAFLSDDRLVSSCTRHLTLWDVKSGRLIMQLPDGSQHLAINPATGAIAAKDTPNTRNFRVFTPAQQP